MFSLRSVLRGPHATARNKRLISSCRLADIRFEALEERRLLSATADMIADIGVRGMADLHDSAIIDGVMYYRGTTPQHGEELWRTDGTASGTFIVRDINSLATTTSPRQLTEVGGTLFFIALNSTGTAFDLWKSDGTEVGTTLVKTLSASLAGPGIQSLTNVDGTLFFVTSDAEHGQELWKSDGTDSGTTLVKDIAPGAAGGEVNSLTSVAGRLFFRANDGATGAELWTSDGTEQGTALVKDIAPGIAGSNPSGLINRDGSLLFSANDGSTGTELWTSDGTGAGTTLVADINPTDSSSPDEFTIVGSATFFWADGGDGRALWKTDGSAAGTLQVSAVSPPDLPSRMLNVNGTLFFASQRSPFQTELWRSDGTSEGTVPIRSDYSLQGAYPSLLSSLEGELYFMGRHGATDWALWKTDGTEDGTVVVDTAQISELHVLNGEFLYSSYVGKAAVDLWAVDSEWAAKRLLKGVSEGGSNPSAFTAVGAQTFFFVPPSDKLDMSRWGLWITDSTPTGTKRLAQLRISNPEAINVNGILYFTVDGNPGQTVELWKSDGTIEGTSRVKSFTRVLQHPWSLTNAAGTLVFSANDGVNGTELWKSDGTTLGTKMVKDIKPNGSSQPSQLLAINGVVYFQAISPSLGTQLWRSDGTAHGTFSLTETAESIRDLTEVGGVLYFTTTTSLYKSAGTVEGTTFVASVQPDQQIEANGTLYFTTYDAVNRTTRLWKTDGTTQGTITLAALAGRVRTPLVAFEESILLVAESSIANQLWRVRNDGSEFTLLNGVNSGIAHALTTWVTVVDNAIYFVASDGLHGDELWSSDGTASGTRFVRDIQPGALGSNPTQLANANGLLYFRASNQESGAEPWVVAPPAVARLFYNNSAFDQVAGASGDADDAALAVDKLPYVPGNGLATAENVSSYSKGINGLFIDLASGHGEITADDFVFRMGTTADPTGWNQAPAPISITVRAGAGIAGHDRVEIVFADGAIKNSWLEVIVRGNDARGGLHTNTGLDESSVFYFGSRLGDTFNGNTAGLAATNIADSLQIRGNANPAAVSGNRFDINRDGLVNIADELIARNNPGLLLMLDLPELASAAPLAATASAAAPLASAIASALASARQTVFDSPITHSLQHIDQLDDALALGSRAHIAQQTATESQLDAEALVSLAIAEISEESAEGDHLLDALLHPLN